MRRRTRLVFKYLRSLSGILILLGVLFLGLSGYFDWNHMLQNVGLALTAAGITTFLLKFDIYEMISDSGIRESGVEAVKHGRNAMLEYVGGIEEFLRKARPRQIDICGIAMYSLFEPHSLYDLLISLARESYEIRLIFANPASPELALQEEVEHKPGSLKNHIEYIRDALSQRLNEQPDKHKVTEHLSLYYSRLLPKSFIIRSGSRIIVTKYFHRGPHFAPCYLIKDVPEGVYQLYLQYVDDIINNASQSVDIAAYSSAEKNGEQGTSADAKRPRR